MGTMRALTMAGKLEMVCFTHSGISPSTSITTMASPPRLSRYRFTVPMLIFAWASTLLT